MNLMSVSAGAITHIIYNYNEAWHEILSTQKRERIT